MLPLTEAQKRVLLRLAREALEAGMRGQPLAEICPPPDAPLECCAAFVTLHRGDRLRGCIGHLDGLKPLYQTVRECALSAALHDRRFSPVTSDELPDLHIEISALSPFIQISPEQLEVGHHGLFISCGLRRGLLLPQVAVQRNWDRERFLNETCRKAGLEENTWQCGAKIEAFTAEVFAEPADPANSSPHAA